MLAVQFGRRTVAVAVFAGQVAPATQDEVRRFGNGPRVAGPPMGRRPMSNVHPADRQRGGGGGEREREERSRARVGRGGAGARAGYSPTDSGGDGAGVAGDCDSADNTDLLDGSDQSWCYGMQEAGPIPIGSGEVVIAGNGGTNTLTLVPNEAVVMLDFIVRDPSNRILFTSAIAGRCNYIEAGSVGADYFSANGTRCKMFRGFRLFPSNGITFTATNPTAAGVPVVISGSCLPVPCRQRVRMQQKAA